MWTDAVFPLADYLRESQPGAVYVADWGMGNTLRLFLKNHTRFGDAINSFMQQDVDDVERQQILSRIKQSRSVFVSYTEGWGFFPNAGRLVMVCALEAGFHKEVLRLIPDRRGRPIFQVYRFISH